MNGSERRTFCTARVIAQSPMTVFDAFSDPEKLAIWWGPEGFTNTFDEFEFSEGGSWRFMMHGPNGSNYPNESVFRVIEPARRVVIDHVCAPKFILTVNFEPVDDGTLISWMQVFESASIADAVRHIVEPANEQNLDRLNRLVCSIS